MAPTTNTCKARDWNDLVLIYLYSEDEPEKAALALQCAQEPDAWISTQVLNEVSNVLRRKQQQAYPDTLKVI